MDVKSSDDLVFNKNLARSQIDCTSAAHTIRRGHQQQPHDLEI